MSKTITQLTETTTVETEDFLHLVDIANNQDKKIKTANLWSGKPYGESYVTGNTTDTVISVATTYYDLTNATAWVTSPGLLNDFTHDTANGSLTYTGVEDITIEIHATLSIASVAAAGAVLVGVQVQKNTVAQTKITSHGIVGGNTAAPPGFRCIVVNGLLTITNGDEIKLTVNNETDTTNLEIKDFVFSVTCL